MFKLILYGFALFQCPVHLCPEMEKGEALCTGFRCNHYRILWIEVRPVRAALPGL